ncbi:hypothetical protein ABIA32_000946 [Streptacidiphilus sp. MAP12-20]|uniref:hypothetical protein n=1 Tax=Streptacidiphilus sp. MAP12-20 TaxID=3156299 RepID=UPI003513E2AE
MSSPPVQQLVLDRIEAAFLTLGQDPQGPAFDGASLGSWLPMPTLRLDRMRGLLLRPPHAEAVPSIWRELVTRVTSAEDQELWLLVALGAMNPGMRSICRRGRLDLLQQQELQSEVVAQVLKRLRSLDPAQPALASELYWTAKRADSQFRRDLIASEQRNIPVDAVPELEAGADAGHPDTALAQLCKREVISGDEAELIGRTRLEGESLTAAAERLGISYATCRKRRRRAEHRIVQHYVKEGLLTATRAQALLGDGSKGSTRSEPASCKVEVAAARTHHWFRRLDAVPA